MTDTEDVKGIGRLKNACGVMVSIGGLTGALLFVIVLDLLTALLALNVSRVSLFLDICCLLGVIVGVYMLKQYFQNLDITFLQKIVSEEVA